MSDTAAEPIRVSVVIPVYNEEESLGPLYDRLQEVLPGLNCRYEIVFVDDGSRDRSPALLRDLATRDPNVRVVLFRRNYGQTAALDAGFHAAEGDVLIPMDADLQNDPGDIPRLLEQVDLGFDVVHGWRKNRHDTYITRVLPSRIANWLISKTTGVRLHDYGCTLTAYRREIMQDIHLYGEMHRFIPVYARWAGARITEMVVTHHPRRFGRTKYGLSRTFRVLLDLMTVRFLLGYTTKPLYYFGKYAALSFLVTLLTFTWTLYDKFFADPPVFVHRNPLFLIGIFFGLMGVQILFFGLLAELSTRTHFESKNRPAYFVRETLNLPAKRKEP